MKCASQKGDNTLMYKPELGSLATAQGHVCNRILVLCMT